MAASSEVVRSVDFIIVPPRTSIFTSCATGLCDPVPVSWGHAWESLPRIQARIGQHCGIHLKNAVSLPIFHSADGRNGELFPPPGQIVRGVIHFWSAFLFNIVFTAVLGLIAIVGQCVTFNRRFPRWIAASVWSPGLLWASGAEYRVSIADGIDWNKPHVFVMNHQSWLDIPAALHFIPTDISFVAKHELKWLPIFGWYMSLVGMIFVHRGRTQKAIRSLRRAGKRIRDGVSILTYPEGTRTNDGTIGPFKKGPFMVALEAEVPIIPVAITGAYEVLPRNAVVMRPRPIYISIGAPIPTQNRGNDRDALMAEVRNAVCELHSAKGGAIS